MSLTAELRSTFIFVPQVEGIPSAWQVPTFPGLFWLPLMSSPLRKRHGFTLGEVLVTVAIVAVLAAVVMPAITGQITKGDLGRVQSDLQALQGAISQFV